MEIWTFSLPTEGFPLLVLGSLAGLSVLATTHILLTRKESSSAVAWTALVWASPGLGPLLYVLFGINRVQRKAVRLLGRVPPLPRPPPLPKPEDLPDAYRHLPRLARGIGAVVGDPLLGGNQVVPLRNGDAVYPRMLAAIDTAQHSLSFLTYILDDDAIGRAFVDALIRSHQRGVAVRVLIDGIGARRSWGPVKALLTAGVPTEIFLWSWKPWKMALINLRNHRKLLVADGRLAFTGGINISEDFVARDGQRRGRDLHFQLEGPIVRQLQTQFVIDWAFSAGEALHGDAWFPPVPAVGTTFARAIPDGPDEDLLKIGMTLFQAVSLAREKILVLTPYFLPPHELHAALIAAAQRGVEVRVLLPENNQPWWMNRATLADIDDLLAAGVHLGFQPGPFEHSKLFVVDDAWMLFGSTNWDLRSLRMNFELDVEAYDIALVQQTLELLADDLPAARWVTLDDLRRRPLHRKLIDASIRLFKPWL